MKFVDEFRDPSMLIQQLAQLRQRITRRWVIMDVCGGQTHGLLRHGLEEALADVLELVHGPGCPVCVTPADAIDDAIELAQRPNVVLTSFGDMLRVPAKRGTLLQAKAAGANVRTVYSPVDAVRLAAEDPGKHIVFFGVGFETTAPATALAVLQAHQRGLQNFSLLVQHVRVEPAMQMIMRLPGNHVQAFLAAGHVCTVTGFAHYQTFVDTFAIPVVVTGFEPLDLILGLTECVEQLETQRAELRNPYARSAQPEGNVHARRLIDEVYDVATVPWRGLGWIPEGGFALKEKYRDFDARYRFGLEIGTSTDDGDCRSADIMAGHIKPPDCPLFGITCTPDHPAGAPMVSSEGACAAYFRYAGAVKKVST